MWLVKSCLLFSCGWLFLVVCEATVYRRDRLYGPRYRPLWPKGAKNKYTRHFGEQSIKDLIENAGFIHENYTITTQDGFILNMNRLVHPENAEKEDKGYPLLLMNGFFMHADSWLIQQDMDSNLAAVWGALGYDIWIGEQRATIRSLGHVKYNSEVDKAYWDHSRYKLTSEQSNVEIATLITRPEVIRTEEIGLYDYSAFLDFILRKTGYKNLVIACISLGCGYHAALIDQKPEYNEKILGAFYFNPLVNNIQRTIDMPLSYQLQLFLPLALLTTAYERTGNFVFPKRMVGLKKETYYVCRPFAGPLVFFMRLGNNGAFHQPMNEGSCYAVSLTSGGASIKSTRHVLQMYEKGDVLITQIITEHRRELVLYISNESNLLGEFIKYNYGREENLKRYGQESAPVFDMKKITSFVAIYYSDADSFTSVKGIQKTLKSLGGPAYSCLMPNFNHLDVGAGTAFKYIFPDVNQVMDSLVGYSEDNQRKAMSGECPSMEWVRNI